MTQVAEVDHPLLSLQDVGVRFGSRTALAGISFELPVGTVAAVVGPNGSGKTTLLRLLAGAIVPSSGHLVWPRAARRQRVAFVAQTVALYPFLTLRENCVAAGRMEGARGTVLAARVEAALERTLCKSVEHQLAGRLSGGYARRAAIAAALMGDAPLVILDEPTTGLDAEGTEAIVAIVRGLRSAGQTVVTTTHDFAFADAIVDLALFLRDGSLMAASSPRRLCRQLFPAKTHVEITLAVPPEAVQVRLLETMGANRRSAESWSLFSDLDAQGSPTIIRRLHEAGIALRETRSRQPGVAVLFERFCLDRGTP